MEAIRIDNKYENNFDNDIKIVYLKKEEIPQIKIINKNLMLYDNQNYKINDYIEKINDNIKKIKDNNNNSNNFLDDIEYDHCKKCKNNLNKHFCIKCQKNICDKCYDNCKEEKHYLITLDNVKLEYENNIKNIKIILNNNIIPIENEKIIFNNNIN